MRTFHATTFAALAALALAANPTFVLDCTDSPQACNNDCYGIFQLSLPSTLDYDKPSSDTKLSRRQSSGCTQTVSNKGKSACDQSKGISPYNGNGNSCDEYPYASTTQGGGNAVLRCMSNADNKAEGDKLSGFYKRKDGGCNNAACTFNFMMKSGTFNNSPYCVNMGGANDGNEFKFSGGSYVNARFVSKRASGEYEPVIPDPANIFPLHLRREFLLSNGERALLMSRDLESFWDNATVASDTETYTVVRELFGDEKSEPFRPLV